MEHFFSTIERVRTWPEPVRRQLLWLIVIVVSAVIAAIWLMTLRWQIGTPNERLPAQTTASEQQDTLPSILESLKRSSSVVSAELKAVARQLLLRIESLPQQSEQVPQAEERGSSSSDGLLPRLPSR